jgi:SnoaL-like protein
MITVNFAESFAANWAAAWNSHDLNVILSHYSDDFSIETPMALKLVPESNGIVSGKENVRAYWKIGLERIPDLHFEILDVLTGINSLTIYYVNTATGRKSAENLFFNESGKVHRAFVMYS